MNTGEISIIYRLYFTLHSWAITLIETHVANIVGCRNVFRRGGLLSLSSPDDLFKLRVVHFKLLFMNLLLDGLCLLLLSLSTSLSDLLKVELVLSLEFVGGAARAQKASQEGEREEEAANGVPGESVRGDDAEGEDSPPME